jgi:Uma2 family endonuclease
VQPQVVFEIRSHDQDVAPLKAKCRVYVEAGVKEAVLIDPQGQCSWVYKEDDLEPPAIPDTEWWQSNALSDFKLCVGLITRPENKDIEREYTETYALEPVRYLMEYIIYLVP